MHSKKDYLIRKPLERTGNDYAVFRILGPYGVTEILSIGKSGELSRECEFAAENDFWFSLSDQKEVKKHFFVDEFPFGKKSLGSEETQPDVLESTQSVATLNNFTPTTTSKTTDVDIQIPQRAPGIEKVNIWSFFLALAVALSFISLIWLLRSLRV